MEQLQEFDRGKGQRHKNKGLIRGTQAETKFGLKSHGRMEKSGKGKDRTSLTEEKKKETQQANAIATWHEDIAACQLRRE